MNTKSRNRSWFRLLAARISAGLVMLLVGFTAVAAPAITSDYAKPHYSSLKNQEQFTDMRVKVLGGFVRITRRWEGDEWLWNSRWQGLSVEADATILQEQLSWLRNAESSAQDGSSGSNEGPAASFLATPPPILYRAGQVYRRVTIGEQDATYENQLDQHIRLHPEGYTWTDSKGNGIEYNRYGQIISYYDKNDIQVYITRDGDGYITNIKDHHENVVISYEWEPVPGADPEVQLSGTESSPRRLSRISDYSGRTVTYTWNDSHQLTEIVDVRGSAWAMVYDADGLLTQVIDPDDRATHYDISSEGRLYSRINSDGVGVDYEFSYDEDKDEYYLSESHTSGEVKETWYNPMGQVVRSSESGEEQQSVEIILSDNSIGPDNLIRRYRNSDRLKHWYRGQKLVAIERPNYLLEEPPLPEAEPVYVKFRITTDSDGNKTVREFDQWKNEISVTYPDDSTIKRTWNGEQSLLLAETNELGVTTQYEYDDQGRRITETHAYGTEYEDIIRYTYDPYGQVESVTLGEAQGGELSVTRFEYDPYGNLLKRTDPLGGEITWADYDGLGNARFRKEPVANASGLDHRWESLYDQAGNLLASNDPYGNGIQYDYDLTGHLVGVTDAQGHQASLQTNARGLPAEITDAQGHVSTIEYDNAYRRTTVIDANEHVTQTRYDNRGRVTAQIDGEGNEVHYTYSADKLAEITYPTFREGYSYDSRDRLTQTLQQANEQSYIRTQEYDSAGNRTLLKDAMNNAEHFEYDPLGRLSQVIDAEGGNTEFRYDYLNNVTYVSDPEGRVTQYEYDLKGRVVAEYKGEGGSRVHRFTYRYDANDNLSTVINGAGEKTAYHYDVANRRVSSQVFASEEAAHPVKAVTYQYNNGNQLAGYAQTPGVNDEGQPTEGITGDVIATSKTYTYTANGQIESVTVNLGAFTKHYHYTYYPNGLRKTYTNPEGITYTYYYNKINELTAVHLPGSGQLSFTDFFWQAPQTLLLPGGGKITLSYDDFLQVKERILEDPANNAVVEAVYQYDLEHNIEHIIGSEGAYGFTYDRNYRLIAAEYPALTAANDEQFDYDGVGNRTRHTITVNSEPGETETESEPTEWVYNDQNQLIQKGDATFTYNANGHTATKTENGQVTEYLYNHEERLTALTVDGQTKGQYAYNPEGHRIKKTVNGVTTYFLYNEEGLAAEYDASGNLIKEYHFKPYSPWMTEPLFQRDTDGQVYYYQNDHLGTPQRMVKSNGSVVWQAYYSAFGAAEVTIETVENNLRFPGQYFDRETGLHHNYFRDYDPILGRYVQLDPAGFSEGTNLYTYVSGNPLAIFDPEGLKGGKPSPWIEIIDLVSSIVDNVACNRRNKSRINSDGTLKKDTWIQELREERDNKKEENLSQTEDGKNACDSYSSDPEGCKNDVVCEWRKREDAISSWYDGELEEGNPYDDLEVCFMNVTPSSRR